MRSISSSQRQLLATQSLKFQQALRTPAGESRLRYLVEDRGLSEATIAQFQLGAAVSPEAFGEDPADTWWWDDELAYWAPGRISIPFLTPTGTVLIRYVEPPPRSSPAKYWQPAGSYIGLFNTLAVLRSPAHMVVVEGEMDAMTLTQLGVPAVGIPGAGNWSRRGHYPAIFDGFEEIIYVQEDDEKEFDSEGNPVESAAERLGQSIKQDLDNVRVVKLPRGHDSNSLYVAAGPDALHDLLKIPEGSYL